jgi:hypothetical protein
LGRRTNRSTEESPFEIQIVEEERAIIMSKIAPMQPQPFFSNLEIRQSAPVSIDTPAKGEENLPNASQGRMK